MKHLCYIAILAFAFFTNRPSYAQEATENTTSPQDHRMPRASRGEREEKKDGNLPGLTAKAQELNERLAQEIGNPRWMRVIYRQVDLMKEQNAPLYYPAHPANGQKNFFSRIFQLLSENKIKAYEYLDGYEEFSDTHLVNFKDLLDRFYILYEEIPGRGNTEPAFAINESDIPSGDVRSYYVKEAWYFDQSTSTFDVKILAVCPILTAIGDMGETTMPMFWLPYENIRPYISNTPVMTSSANNATVFTIDDYFRRRMFDGEIIKTQNLMNQPLQAYCPTPDSLKSEQERIENQLVGFEKSLWIRPDTSRVTTDGKKGKVTRGAMSAPPKEKTVKANAPKTEKSAPVRSVRRRQ